MNASRRKRLHVVRRLLIESAAQIAAEQGFPSVTVQTVAEAANVSKGALFHHFPNKQALLDEMSRALLDDLDLEIDAQIAQDPLADGALTRAYVKAVFDGRSLGFDTPWSVLFVAIIGGPTLRFLWSDWLDRRLAQHKGSDGNDDLQIVRLAADGAWLSYLVAGEGCQSSSFSEIREHLLGLTTGPNGTA